MQNKQSKWKESLQGLRMPASREKAGVDGESGENRDSVLKGMKRDELLEILRLTDRRNHLPGQLSGGQQQRTAIGRALFTRPSLILADEPTGNLDSENSSEVIGLLKKTSEQFQQTILMITHSRPIARTADRVLSVSDGIVTDLGRSMA